jgi:predicted HTH transcriptional regulator
VIQQKLLDGRDRLHPFELDQFILLFGSESEVAARLGREMAELRVRTSEGKRWDERLETHHNVLQSLRVATDFFQRHVSVGAITVEALKQTSGSPDYVAMREAMINLFIHQDYNDKRAPAQIDIAPGVVTFFNLGFSFVEGDKVSSGVKSYPRNPLIARALRLIGFAELAASGLRELQRVWQKADRRIPQVTSDEKTNSFTLVLEWRNDHDASIERLADPT